MPFGSGKKRKKSTKADQKRILDGTRLLDGSPNPAPYRGIPDKSFSSRYFPSGVPQPGDAGLTVAGGAAGYIKELGGLDQARKPVGPPGFGVKYQMYGPRGPRMAPRNIDPRTGMKKRKKALTIPKIPGLGGR